MRLLDGAPISTPVGAMPVGQLIASQLYDVYELSTALWACGHRHVDVQWSHSPLPVQKPSDLQPSPMALASSMDRGATTSTPDTYVESISIVWSNVSFKRNTFAPSR